MKQDNTTHHPAEPNVDEAASAVYGKQARNRRFRRSLNKKQAADLLVIESWLRGLKKNFKAATPVGMEGHESWYAQQQVYERAKMFMESWNAKHESGARSFLIPPTFPTNICQKLGLVGPEGELPPPPPEDEVKNAKVSTDTVKLIVVYAAIAAIVAGIVYYFI
jgi:hypothetical protein